MVDFSKSTEIFNLNRKIVLFAVKSELSVPVLTAISFLGTKKATARIGLQSSPHDMHINRSSFNAISDHHKVFQYYNWHVGLIVGIEFAVCFLRNINLG